MFANLLRFILGFTLAIAILICGGGTIALYFMNRTSIPPTKPIFAHDHPVPKPKLHPKPKREIASTKRKPSPSPSPKPSPTQSPDALPPGASRGVVIWPEGLSLRAEPNQDAEKIGGVGSNQKVIILQESDDKAWKKIRAEGSEESGWVKSGNIKQTQDQPDNTEQR
jgi:hypothetical protein